MAIGTECFAFRRAAFAASMLLGVATASGAEDWAEVLGYPPGKKVVVLHANEMGLCFETNEAVAALIEDGRSLSASAMAPCVWFPHAADYAKSHPDSDVGLELTLTSEWPLYRWAPVSGRQGPTSLSDSHGYLWRSVLQMAVSASSEDVSRELDAQLLRAERTGMRPTHLTTHLGALYARPDLAGVYLDFARKNWIPAVVVDLTPELMAHFADHGLQVSDSLAQLIAEYPLPKLRELRIVPRTESYEEKLTNTLTLIDNLPAGISQLVFAPATETDALKSLTPDWRQYVWDFELLRDDKLKQRLSKDDVVLTTWTEIMRRFDASAR